MCGRVRVISGCEVPVKRSDDGVFLPLFYISPEKTEYAHGWTPEKSMGTLLPPLKAPVPLSNAGSTGVGQDHAPNIVEDLGLEEETEEGGSEHAKRTNGQQDSENDSRIHLFRWWLGSARTQGWRWTELCTSGLYLKPAWPQRRRGPYPHSWSLCSCQSGLKRSDRAGVFPPREPSGRLSLSVRLTNFDLQWPAALLSGGAHVRHRVSQIGGKGAVDVRLQLLEQETIWSGSNQTGGANRRLKLEPTWSRLISMTWSYSQPSSGTNRSAYPSAKAAISG